MVGLDAYLSVTYTTGDYSFVPKDSAIEALKSATSKTFTLTVSDGSTTINQTLKLSITQPKTLITETNDNDTLTGTANNDKFNGLAGNDSISGLNGNDTLQGGTGNDILSGGKDNDVLIGGAGTDKLTGGAGSDSFDFNSITETIIGKTHDSITDFSHSQSDKVDLKDIDANLKVAGDQASKFIGKSAFDGKAGEIRYVNGVLSGDINLDKTSDFDIAITVVGSTNLVTDDFIL